MEFVCPNCKHEFKMIRKNHYKCTHCKREYLLSPTFIYYLFVGIFALVVLQASETLAGNLGFGREIGLVIAIVLAILLSIFASKNPALLVKLKFYRMMEMH